MKQQWKYSEPVFEADQYHDIILRYSPWSGHRRFAYDLTVYYEPGMIVELGSFYGCSAFSFMQAVKDHSLKTKIYAVDLWEAGDSYTLHDYEQDVYGFFCKVKEKVFGGIDVEMLKMPFGQANQKFGNHVIDILHIDGSHSYQDVKQDFELWISKMKKDGIVLFHDISDQLLYGETLGSSLYWHELKKKYKYTIEMPYSWGLGILFLSKEKYKDFKGKVDVGHYLKWNLYEAENCKDKIRKDYFKLQDAAAWIDSLQRDKKTLEDDNTRLLTEIKKIQEAYEKTIREKDVYIHELQNSGEAVKTDSLQRDKKILENDNTRLLAEIKKIQEAYEKTIREKDAYIRELQDCDEAAKIKQDYENTIEGKDAYIEELEQRINKMSKTIP